MKRLLTTSANSMITPFPSSRSALPSEGADYTAEDFERGIDFLLADDERGDPADHLVFRPAGEEEKSLFNTASLDISGDLTCRSLTKLPKLHADHESQTPHVADEFALSAQTTQGLQQVLPHAPRVLDETFGLDYLDGCYRGGTCDGVTAERAAMGSGRPAGRKVRPDSDGAQRQA